MSLSGTALFFLLCHWLVGFKAWALFAPVHEVCPYFWKMERKDAHLTSFCHMFEIAPSSLFHIAFHSPPLLFMLSL